MRALSKEGRNLLLAAGLNALFMVCVLSVFPPFFEENDDFLIRLFLDGSLGFQEYRTGFLSVILSGPLMLCYRLLPRVPWYGLAQYALLLCAYTAITWVLLQRWQTVPALLLSAGLLLIFGTDSYVVFQFTRTAAVAVVGGLSLLMYAQTQEKRSRFTLALGLLLALGGFMLRRSMALACGLIAGTTALDLLFADGRPPLREMLRPFLLLLALFGVVYLIDQTAYAGSEWQDYLSYNKARVEVLDYCMPVYARDEALFREKSISPAMITLIQRWSFYDTEVIDTDTFRWIASLCPRRLIGGETGVLDFFPVSGAKLIAEWSFAGLLLTAAVWLLFGRRRGAALPALALACVCTLLLLIFFFLNNRSNMARVDFGVFLAFASCFLWFLPGGKPRSNILTAAVIVLLAAALIGKYAAFSDGDHVRTFRRGSAADDKALRRAEDRIRQEPRLLFTDFFLYDLGVGSGPLRAAPEGIYDHMIMLGGWQAEHPATRKLLARYGIDNPFRALAERDDVLLGVIDEAPYMEYLSDTYAPGITCERLYTLTINEYPCGIYELNPHAP